MHKIYDFYLVYVFPNGTKRLSMNLAGFTLKRLTRKYGNPILVTYSYEQVCEEGIK